MKKRLIDLVKSVELAGGAVAPPDVLALANAVRSYAGIVEDLGTILNDAIEAMYQGAPLPPAVNWIISTLTNRMAAVRIVEVPDVC